MDRNTTQAMMLVLAVSFGAHAHAQTVLLDEQFTGGMSTTGFTTSRDGGDCDWIYAPGGLTENVFNQDYDDTIPSGPGFDTDFAFIDSDECTGSGGSVNAFLTSPAFDTSEDGSYHLTFSHQFKSRLSSFARVEVYNGSTWTQVANWTGEDMGYPNPAVDSDLDITAATGGSAAAQFRFQFNSGWDWWWAVDNVQVVFTASSGVKEYAGIPTVQVFPNPATTVLNVPNVGVDAVRMSIIDGTGRTVQERGAARTIAVDELPAGMYTVLLRTNAGDVRARGLFIKQ